MYLTLNSDQSANLVIIYLTIKDGFIFSTGLIRIFYHEMGKLDQIMESYRIKLYILIYKGREKKTKQILLHLFDMFV